MHKLDVIVVPIDFSAHSKEAVETAIGLARRLGGQIHLVHALQFPAAIATPGGIMVSDEWWNSVRDAAGRKLLKAANTVSEAGVTVETHLGDGPSDVVIVNLAKKLEADLIVMGTRGLSGLKHVLLGSVAERTVRSAPCPVMTLKPKEE